MEQMPEPKKRQPRRNKMQMQQELFKSITDIIVNQGFAKLGVNNVADTSGTIKRSIYTNYISFERLLQTYYIQHDFGNAAELKKIAAKNDNPSNYFAETIKNVYAAIDKNILYQTLVRWEVASPDEFIQKRAKTHEINYYKRLIQHKEYYEKYEIDIEAFYALLIAGIYHLVLRKKISTFCHINAATKNGKERICQAIDQIGKLLDLKMQQTEKNARIAGRLREKGMSDDEIAELLEVEKDAIGGTQ